MKSISILFVILHKTHFIKKKKLKKSHCGLAHAHVFVADDMV